MVTHNGFTTTGLWRHIWVIDWGASYHRTKLEKGNFKRARLHGSTIDTLGVEVRACTKDTKREFSKTVRLGPIVEEKRSSERFSRMSASALIEINGLEKADNPFHEKNPTVGFLNPRTNTYDIMADWMDDWTINDEQEGGYVVRSVTKDGSNYYIENSGPNGEPKWELEARP